jgi:poly-gamma-glutamate synthesis protein (capsule biosynthesis protein)
VEFTYIWGDALAAFDATAPDLRIINLETAVTRTGTPWPGKGIQYRMHPDNIPCLSAARIDCGVLANNHVLDWGYAGLEETLATLSKAGLTTVGAGADQAAAQAPAVFPLSDRGRVLVFAWGSPSSGVPAAWAATPGKPGLNLLEDFSNNTADRIAAAVEAHRQPGDRVVISLHWGGNWGYAIPEAHIRFAHALIDEAGADLIHGHSSHHPLGIEVYRGRPVLYGCGDLVRLDRTRGELLRLEMIPMRRQRFRLTTARSEDIDWLGTTLDRESRRLGAGVSRSDHDTLQLDWT